MNKIEIASYIAARVPDVDEMQLQKLLYFTHGWSLAWRGRPLFPGAFEAWIGGPVDDEIWRAKRSGHLTAAPTLSDADRALVDSVIDHYSHLSGKQMSDLTHAAGTPWSLTRGDLPPYTGSKRHIPDREIKSHFLALALSSPGNPKRPRDASEVALTDALAVSSAQSRRWREALDELATR